MGKISKLERNHRLTKIIRLISEKPDISKKELLHIITNKYDINQRQAYNYLREIEDMYKEFAAFDIAILKGRLLKKNEFIYTNALKQNNLNVALGCNKLESTILGLDQITVKDDRLLDVLTELKKIK